MKNTIISLALNIKKILLSQKKTRRVLLVKDIIHKKLENYKQIQHFIEENTILIVYTNYTTHDNFKY